ncbi:MAG: trypsin-like peptidase domain-containing protein [Elusimicrobiota bacterium]|nr:MAG: trypsin-like peptidase domain-containing protein [Elusimicrobiota bacterium]
MRPLLLAVLLLGRALPARALLADEENTIKVFKGASRSVVYVTNVAITQSPYMDEQAIPQGTGSGFVWDKKGHIVTNFHVVQGGNAFLVTLGDQTQLEAKLIGADPTKDIAVLRVEKSREALVPVRVGKLEALQVGQKTIAIGNPFGLDHTLTTGVISALGREVQGVSGITIRDMIQTDAAINPGNSGGPLLDSDGNLIGMNTMIYSRSGGSAGIGFAVPVSFIARIVPELIAYGKVVRPGMGITILNTGQKYYLIGEKPGVVVNEVTPGGPAAKAGLRGLRRLPGGRVAAGDIIVGVESHKVRDFDDLYNAFDRYKPGDTVAVRIERAGKELVLPVKLVNIQ